MRLLFIKSVICLLTPLSFAQQPAPASPAVPASPAAPAASPAESDIYIAAPPAPAPEQPQAPAADGPGNSAQPQVEYEPPPSESRQKDAQPKPKSEQIIETHIHVPGQKPSDNRRVKQLFAILHLETKGQALGKIKIRLEHIRAPNTVDHFTALAEGTKEFFDPEPALAGKKISVKRPYYNGQVIHRVIPRNFIQMGCPYANGKGTPGYYLDDEITPVLQHDRPGIVGMANTPGKPNSNSSQFYITLAPQPQLDGNNTVFGYVVEGLDLAQKISRVKKNRADRPLTDIVIKQVQILREY